MSAPEALKDPSKKKRRRRNYDDYDNEVAQEEKELKDKKKLKVSAGGANGADSTNKTGSADNSDSDSDVDDAKLDLLMGNELDDEDDDLAEIDTTNIITSGRRTRGKVIDYKKAAEELDKVEGSAAKEAATSEEATKKTEAADDYIYEDDDFKD